MMFNRKNRVIADKVSELAHFSRTLRDLKVELLALGNTVAGNHMQIRTKSRNALEVADWAERALRKLHNLKYVEIEITGYDADGDYTSSRCKFETQFGTLLLQHFKKQENALCLHQSTR